MKRLIAKVAPVLCFALFTSVAYTQDPAPAAPGETTVTRSVRIAPPAEETTSTESFAKTYIVTTPNELLAGNLADGFIGDIVLENDRLRAVIARPGKPEISTIRGGGLIDIASTKTPVDFLNSLNTTTDPLTTGSIVIYDRIIGRASIARTTASVTLGGYVGNPGDSTDAYPGLTVQTNFSLERGSRALSITTDFINETTRPVWITPADTIDWGEAIVFAEGSGYEATDQPVNYVIGSASPCSLGYFTTDDKPIYGYHNKRKSVVLAGGEVPGLAARTEARARAALSNMDERLQPEYRGYGATISPSPGYVMFPGTESRYGQNSEGLPMLQPLYVPAESVREVDGVTTVTSLDEPGRNVFEEPVINKDQYTKIDPGQRFTFRRQLIVADTDWAPISNMAYKTKGVATGQLVGVVLENRTGNPVPNATIRISGGPGWKGNDRPGAMFQTTTREDGTFAVYVPEGTYRVSPVAIGRRRLKVPAPVEVKAGGTSQIIVTHMSTESVLRLAISEAETETSSPLPVKVTLISKPPFEPIDYGFNADVTQGERNVRYMPQGAAVFPVTPGRYRLVVSRGLEYDIFERDIVIAPGQEMTIAASLPHSLKEHMPPLVSMDAGVITNASSSGFATAESQAIQAACEGVSIIISGDYRKATNLQTAIRNQGLEKWVKAFMGRREIIHHEGLSAELFVYPLDESSAGEFDAALANLQGLPPDIVLADLKEQFPNLIFEISRPLHFEAGYLKDFPFNASAQAFPNDDMPPPDFDAIQIMDGKKTGAVEENYLRYIAMQKSRLGTREIFRKSALSPVGSTRSSLPYGQETGYPRTYIYLKNHKPLADITAQDVVSAIRGQHFLVTNGPILLLNAGDYSTGEYSIRPGDILDLQTTEVLHLRAQVLAAPWVHLEGLNTRENGRRGITVFGIRPNREVRRYPTTDVHSNHYTRYLKKDAIVDGYAYSTVESLDPVVPPAPDEFGGPVFPYCWTGPIFVDRDGDGKITITPEDP